MMLLSVLLLIAALAVVDAGIFQRQCYPETVLVTVSAVPITHTTTCTETMISISTTTVTARPRTSTITEKFTGLVTVQGPAHTVTETLQGPASVSVLNMSLTSHAMPSDTSESCTDLRSCGASLGYGTPESITKKAISASMIYGLLTTITVIPLATLPYPSSADEQTFTVSSSNVSRLVVSSPIPTKTSTRLATISIGITETVRLTSFITQPEQPAPFPTLNVTESMGSIFGNNGSVTGTSFSSRAFPTSNSSAGRVATSDIVNPASTLLSNLNMTSASMAAQSTSLNISSVVSSTVSVAAEQTPTPQPNITHGLPIPFGSSLTIPFVNVTSTTAEWAVNLTGTSSSNIVFPTSTQASATPTQRVVSDSRSVLPVSTSAEASASPITLTDRSNSSTSQHTTSGALSSVLQSSSSVSAIDSTQAVSSAFLPSEIPPMTGSAQSAGLAQTSAASGLALTSAAPFANSTGLQLTGFSAPPSRSSSLSGAVSVTSLARRCVGEGQSTLGGGIKKQDMPLNLSVMDDGRVVTFPWTPSISKRQVGQMVTATVNGVAVTWLNAWDGTTLVNLPSVTSAIKHTAFQSSLDIASQFASAEDSTTSLVDSMVSNALSSLLKTFITATAMSTHKGTDVWSARSSHSSMNSPLESITILGTSPTQIPTDEFPTFRPPAHLTSSTPTASTAGVVASTNTIIPTLNPRLQASISDTSTNSITSDSACNGDNSTRFTINFDDLPQDRQDSFTDQYLPLVNPYRKLVWSQGFSYAPPPSNPYQAHSGHRLGVFVVDQSANIHSQNWTGPIPQGDEFNGMIGTGPHYMDPNYYIDAFGAWLGCQNAGPAYCDIQVSGYGYDDASGKPLLRVEQNFSQQPCPSLHDCSLQYFEFSDAFHNLTALQIQASRQGDHDGVKLTWYIDDLALGWTDASCDAIIARGSKF